MSEEWNGLETQLFSWDGWDTLSVGDFQFYDVQLKVDIGEHKAGDKFPFASFMMSTSKLEFYDDDGTPVSTHDLKISVE